MLPRGGAHQPPLPPPATQPQPAHATLQVPATLPMHSTFLQSGLKLLLGLALLAGSARAVTIEAESGTLYKTTVGTTLAGFSGAGYVTDIKDGDASVEVAFTVPEAGTYAVRLRYWAPYGDKVTRLHANGVARGEIALAASEGWLLSPQVVVPLIAGGNTLKVEGFWSWFELDALEVNYLPPAGNEYEAENGTTADGTFVSTARPGYSGSGYVTGFTGATSSVTIPINLSQTGVHQLLVRYASEYDDKYTRLYVDGVDRGEVFLPRTSGFAVANGPALSLAAGLHTLKFETSWGYYDIDRVNLEYAPPPVGTSFEAESGTPTKTTVESSRPGYSGTGYVTRFEEADAAIDIPVNLAAAGTYRLMVRAASPWGPKNTRLFVNGVDQGDVSLAQSESFTAFPGPMLYLPKGLSSVRLARGWGYYEVDRIDFEAVPAPVFNLKPTLVNPRSTPETFALYNYLRAQFGKKILSGQTEDANINANISINFLEDLVGRRPVVRVQDLMFYGSVGRWEEGTPERGIAWHRQEKGIIAMQWHWRAPSGGAEFYTDQTTFDIRKAVDPSQPEYAQALFEIDTIAKELGKYAAARVPILWRPLHEAEGGWFWWGAHGPEPTKKMWRILYDRLTHHHGLNNLIWVWNSVNPDWYPGHDVVDMVSHDAYPATGATIYPPTIFHSLAALGGNQRIVALTENGVLPDIQALVDAGILYSYFATWYGSHITDGVTNPPAHIQSVFSHPAVLTLDEIPDLRAAPGAMIYTGPNHTGTAIDLPQGDYSAQALKTRGLTAPKIASLTVPRGHRLTVFSGPNFTGTSRTFAVGFADLSAVGFSGDVGSIRIRRN